jgi:hypothetical protein
MEVTVQISAKLNGSEVFYPDIEEEIDVVRQFDASLKYVTFKNVSTLCRVSNKSAIKKNTLLARFRIKGKEIRKNEEQLIIFHFNFQKKKYPSLLGSIPPRRQFQTSIFLRMA